jgi:hypothetical protein
VAGGLPKPDGRVAGAMFRSSWLRATLRFVVAFVVLAILGLVGGVVLYGRLMLPLRTVVATHVFHAGTTVPFLGDGQVVELFAWTYDLVMVGGAAFLWAVPRVSRRARAIGIVAVYLPLAIVLDAVLSGAYDPIAVAIRPGAAVTDTASSPVLLMLQFFFNATHLVLPLVLWRRWSRQGADRARHGNGAPRSRLATAATAFGGMLTAAAVIGGVLWSSPGITIAALHGSLHLDSGWSTHALGGGGILDIVYEVAPGARVTPEAALFKSDLDLDVVSFPEGDPTGILDRFVNMQPQFHEGAAGEQVSVAPSRVVAIDGHTAVAQGFQVHNVQGGLVHRGIVYAVNTGDHVVLIRTMAGPAWTEADLATIEKALVAIG